MKKKRKRALGGRRFRSPRIYSRGRHDGHHDRNVVTVPLWSVVQHKIRAVPPLERHPSASTYHIPQSMVVNIAVLRHSDVVAASSAAVVRAARAAVAMARVV